MNNMTAVLTKNAAVVDHAFDDLYGNTRIAGKEVESRHKGPLLTIELYYGTCHSNLFSEFVED